MRRTLWILSFACAFPFIGQAQQRGAAVPAMGGVRVATAPGPVAAPRAAVPARPIIAARPVVHAGHVSTRLAAPPSTPRTIHPVGWNHGTRHSTVPVDPVFPNGNFADNGFPVPGLGFDYPHFFATHPNAGKCRRCGVGGFVVPFVDGGIYVPVPMYITEPAASPAPEQTDAAEQSAQPEEPSPRETYSNSAARVRPQAPPPEQAQYVFIKRDGTIIFAVAYSWLNDRLQYVTEEGLRRTTPLNTLDLDATQQFNDQRGVPIRLPA